MKYPTHGELTVDHWRSSAFRLIQDNYDVIDSLVRTKSFDVASGDAELIPTIAGFAAVGTVYAISGALVVADGPLPFGDAIAAGLLAIPDSVIFAFGYQLFD